MKIIIRNFAFFLATLLMCLSQGCKKPGWISLESGTQYLLNGVWFSDINTGFIVGGRDRGIIMHTTDGGETWKDQKSTSGPMYFGVCFCDSMHGWVVGHNGAILHTTDGGNTWTQQTSGTTLQLYSVFCLDANKVWIVGALGTILQTTNGGAIWSRQASGISPSVWDIFFTSSDTGFAVAGWCVGCWGSPFYGSYILHTTNGGITWDIQKLDTTIIGLYGIFFTSASKGYVVGASGTILSTANGGITWIKQLSGTTNDLWDVFFTDSNNGIVVGGNAVIDIPLGGTILRTTNGGTTWNKQKIPTDIVLRRVYFTDANQGTAVGFYGTILRTTTGGEPLAKNRQD